MLEGRLSVLCLTAALQKFVAGTTWQGRLESTDDLDEPAAQQPCTTAIHSSANVTNESRDVYDHLLEPQTLQQHSSKAHLCGYECRGWRRGKARCTTYKA